MHYWPSLFGQDDRLLALFFSCKFIDLNFVSVYKHTKKGLGQYPAIFTSHLVNIYYIASSVSGYDEPNGALWLVTRVGKMELSCPLGTTHHFPREKFPRKSNNNSLLINLFQVRWLDIGIVLFSRVYGPRLRLPPLTRKKRTWLISSHLDLTLCQ